MAKLHRPPAQSSGDPEVNYPPSVVPVLLNGVSVQSRDRGAGMSGRDEPGSRCLQGPPSQGIPPSPPRTRQHPGETHYLQCQGGQGPRYWCSQMWGTRGGTRDAEVQPSPGWATRLEGAWGQLWVALPAEGTVACLSGGARPEPAPWDSWRGDISSCPPRPGEDRAGAPPWESHRLSRGGRTWQESPQVMFYSFFCSQKPPEFQFLNFLPCQPFALPPNTSACGGEEKMKNNSPQTLLAK